MFVGVPQGSILGLLLFNIYINDIYYFVSGSITNYAGDTTHSIKTNYEELVEALQLDSETLIEWFKTNCFMMNADKCKLLISNTDLYIDIEGETIVCEKLVKLLGIKIDNQLTFSEHVSSICKKSKLKTTCAGQSL